MWTRHTLDTFVGSSSTPQSLALRSRIVLAAAEGSNNQQIAAALRIPAITVGKWRRSFARHGREGLRDAPRSGRPPTHDAATRHQVQTRVCPAKRSQPLDRAHPGRRTRTARQHGARHAGGRPVVRADAGAPSRGSACVKTSMTSAVAQAGSSLGGATAGPAAHRLIVVSDHLPSRSTAALTPVASAAAWPVP